MTRVVLIVGPFRSGTSLVAAIVHRLGWQVAPTIPAPAPPSWRSDWEDPDLTLRLMRGVHVDFDAYLTTRRRIATALGFQGVAIKSAYLSLVWRPLLEAIGEPAPLVVRTYRNEPDRQDSLAAHPALTPAEDQRIERAVYGPGIVPDLEIGYELAVERPGLVARSLADALKVSDHGAIAAAAALVGSPTEYPACRSPVEVDAGRRATPSPS